MNEHDDDEEEGDQADDDDRGVSDGRETIEFRIAESARPDERFDRFLAGRLPEFSRSRLQQLIREGHILVDGRTVKPRDAVEPGALVHVRVPPPRPAEARAEAIPVDLLYEDDDLAVVDKACGLVVHPGSGNPDGTLVNALLHRFGGLSSVGGVERPGIVHRLDRETSGCLVVARNDLAHERLSAQFAERSVEKHYLAVVAGEPSPREGRIENRIGRNPARRQRMAVVAAPAGKPAVTEYQVLGTRQRSSLVLCRLETGRTHQIRVHMKHLGHPLLGDELYGRAVTRHGVDRLMLHAWRLAFDHPRSGRRLSFESPIPAEFDPWVAVSRLPGA